MNRDRLLQTIALAVALIALVGSSLLVGTINRQRRDLQLGFDTEIGDRVPPMVQLASQLGSFRGLAVNTLWYRAEMMKREGKFAEANTLASWITTLQPRYPQVWSFQAWNMAYNISVETFTPQERYDWVMKGVDLLRDQGIVYNPNAVRLYRELGWIFFHKIGKFTDDVNWYYKGQLAEEWEEVLGAAAESRNPELIVADFRNTAEMANAYFTVDKPAEQVRRALDELITAGLIPAVDEQADRLRELDAIPLRDRLRDIRAGLAPEARGVQRLDALLTLIEEQLGRAERAPVVAFTADLPQAADVVRRLRDLGMEMDYQSLRAIGRCQMMLRLRSPDTVATMPTEFLTAPAKKVLPLVTVATTADPTSDLYKGFWQVVYFLRAKALVEHYHMQPVTMLRYMQTYGPLDWRHPASHAAYWSQLGVEKYADLRDKEKTDMINTKRQVIHSMQLLTDAGSVSFNPLNPNPYARIDLLPNPDYIDGYLIALNEAKDMADADEFGRMRAEVFDAGYENFLQQAVMMSWMYGNPAKAQQYFSQLNTEFGESDQNQQYGMYNLALGDFVASMFMDDDLGRVGMQGVIDGRLREAFAKGLGQRRFNVFDRNLQVAAAVHQKYNDKYANETGLDVKDRMGLPPLPEMIFNAFTKFMLDQNTDLITRINAYQAAYAMQDRMPLAAMTYDRFADAFTSEVQAVGFDPAQAIPRPESIPETTPTPESAPASPPTTEGGTTVERQ